MVWRCPTAGCSRLAHCCVCTTALAETTCQSGKQLRMGNQNERGGESGKYQVFLVKKQTFEYKKETIVLPMASQKCTNNSFTSLAERLIGDTPLTSFASHTPPF